MILLFLCIAWSLTCSATISDYLKIQFEDRFQNRCNKYTFVQKYYEMLENPPEKKVIFVFHEKGNDRGGLGDRLSGMLTAFSFAIRFNRHFILKASNDLYRYFRPYHSSLSHYSYHNWHTDNETLYATDKKNLWNMWCINKNTRTCSFEQGDPSQRVVQLHSNRAFLCNLVLKAGKKSNSTLSPAQRSMKVMLGVDKTSDLFEAAGCILRLVLWPTDTLWAAVDEMYQFFDQDEYLKHTGYPVLNPTGRWQMMMEPTDKHPFYQIGTHFRCGDPSYFNSVPHDFYCIHDDKSKVVYKKSPYLRYGTPVDIGKCVRLLFSNATAEQFNETMQNEETFAEIHRKIGFIRKNTAMNNGLEMELDEFGNSVVLERENETQPEESFNEEHPLLYSMAYMASDYGPASQQVAEFSGHPHTYISPQGCHIDYDFSKECFLATLRYWFGLSLSRYIVTQTYTLSETERIHAPISAFSRFAGIYGLYENPFRSGVHCGDNTNMAALSTYGTQGNWICLNEEKHF